MIDDGSLNMQEREKKMEKWQRYVSRCRHKKLKLCHFIQTRREKIWLDSNGKR